MQLLTGVSYRGIARESAISEDALYRHKSEGHITASLAKAHEAREVARADSLLEDLKAVRQRTDELLTRAEEAGEVRSWPGFLREMREQIKLLAELEGRLATQTQVNVLINHPEWVELRTRIVRALAPYPDARRAVINALE
jgi:hypothetical protein